MPLHKTKTEKSSLWDLELQFFVVKGCEGKSGFGELQRDCEVRGKSQGRSPTLL